MTVARTRSWRDEFGLRGASHLRDILGRLPREEAKDDLFALFTQLSEDFNRPTRKRVDVATIKPSTAAQRDEYLQLLCETLNGWASGGKYRVDGRWAASPDVGVGLVLLAKTRRGERTKHVDLPADHVLPTLFRLQQAAARKLGSFELVRGAKVFEENRLYLVKPLGQRFWTKTAALNDADEIAATILTRSSMEEA